METKGMWPRATGAAVVVALAVAPAALATGGGEDKSGKGAPPPHAQNEHAAKSQEPPATPPGQAKKEQHAAQPAAPAPRRGAKRKQPKSDKHAAKAAPKQRSGGGQRKVTICHATGSAKNPYVTITIAEPAVRAHSRHQDGRDIVPAPAGGCPTGEAPKQQAAPATEKAKAEAKAKAKTTNGKSRTTICHATGSETHPYVTITIPEPAVRAHKRHQDGRDIVPAPAGGCPKPEPAKVAAQSIGRALAAVGGSSTPAPPTAPAPARATDPVPPIGTSSMIASDGPDKASRAVAARSDSRDGAQDTLGVIGEIESGGDEGDALPAAQTTSAGDAGGSLPFTGMDLALLALVGAGALLTGIALLRASRMTWRRPTSG